MDIIKNCLKRPIIIYSLIILILFSGLLALFKIPIQLTPDVRKPGIEITTSWQGGSPSEVEREIVVKQEDVLKSVKGVERIRSNAYDKKSEIKLAVACQFIELMLLVFFKASFFFKKGFALL